MSDCAGSRPTPIASVSTLRGRATSQYSGLSGNTAYDALNAQCAIEAGAAVLASFEVPGDLAPPALAYRDPQNHVASARNGVAEQGGLASLARYYRRRFGDCFAPVSKVG